MHILGQLVKKLGFQNRWRWKWLHILPTNGITFAVHNVKFYYHRNDLFINSNPHKCISNPTMNYTCFFKLQNPKSSNIRIVSLPVRFFNCHTQSKYLCSEHWLNISMLISTPAPIILPIPRTSLTGNSESQNTYFYSSRREHSLQQF
jgi:hypothetical protein